MEDEVTTTSPLAARLQHGEAIIQRLFKLARPAARRMYKLNITRTIRKQRLFRLLLFVWNQRKQQFNSSLDMSFQFCAVHWHFLCNS